MSLRALVLGGTGQVGRAVGSAAPEGACVVSYDSRAVDIRDSTAVAMALDAARPAVVFNCAGWTRVDDAETDPRGAHEVNARAPGDIARLVAERGIRLVHLSTDFVFDGEGGAPYRAGDRPGPLNAYGASKLEGEQRVLEACPGALVVRTAWIHAGGGINFVGTALRMLSAGQTMRVVDDQIGTPTRALHLARALWGLADRPSVRGVHHFTDAGVASWYDVAEWIFESLRAVKELPPTAAVEPAPTHSLDRPARRPKCGVLDKHATWAILGWVPPHWRQGVLATIQEYLHA